MIILNNIPFFNIFRKGSRTFFYSSLFFPPNVRREIFILYSFVRTADNLVDIYPQNKKKFYDFKKDFNSHHSSNLITEKYKSLLNQKKISLKYSYDFLISMEMDLNNSSFKTQKKLNLYMYGSSEVIGLIIAKLLSFPKPSYKYARLLGKSMQLLNFIRDIQEDQDLKRTYFANKDLKKFELNSLNYTEISKNKKNFEGFIKYQINKYFILQQEAEKGYKYIPNRYLIPIKTASDLYKWTAYQIYNNPIQIYKKKIKPTYLLIFLILLKNYISIYFFK